MEKSTCHSCQKIKVTQSCGLCSCSVCKNCAQFNDEDNFSFLEKIPDNLKHGVYCGSCYDTVVSPELISYNHTLEDAKNIMVYGKNQGSETRLIKRNQEIYRVVDCPDRDEALLRLAFFAAKAEYNTLVDVDVVSEKVLNGSYQKLKWSGTGKPANHALSPWQLKELEALK